MQLIEGGGLKRQLRETLIINRGGRQKLTHFWSPNKGAYGKKRKRKKRKRKKREIKQRYGSLEFGMEFEYGIVRFCPKTSWVWIARVFF